MSVLINFKICDNSNECGGIAVCPTKALSYDDEKQTIVIDNDKCISCGLCRPQCPVSAILVAKTEEEYEKYKKEITDDSRMIKDLFVDRYGAVPITEFFLIKQDQLEEKISNKDITLIEVFDDNLQCLLKSIPIRDITDDMVGNILFYKIKGTEEITKKYGINTFPSLLIFKAGELLGKIEGYYNLEREKELKELINTFVKQPE